MAPRIWYADQIAHLVTRGPSEASRQFVALADYLELKRIIGSSAVSLAMLPPAAEPAAQKVFLEDVLRRMEPALDALDKAQRPTAADMAREVTARSGSGDAGGS